jgi:hypothetical protein
VRAGRLDLTATPWKPSDPQNEALWVRVYYRVAAGEMPPKRAEQPTPQERAAFQSALGRDLTTAAAKRAGAEGRATRRRLNRQEYEYAVLSQLQPDFAAGYGDMARLIAKEYANYDRADTRFPFLRTLDVWRGHSFADGNGFPEGNNQESTGEAVNSWVGMILLGEALGDADLTAAGVMGYTFETRANLEYWFDPHGDVFPPAYQHKACGMVWCNSVVWGTWFTASPSWIDGIQWLPSGPWMAFYDRDQKLTKRVYADLVRELDAFEAKEAAKKPGAAKKGTDIKAQGGGTRQLPPRVQHARRPGVGVRATRHPVE